MGNFNEKIKNLEDQEKTRIQQQKDAERVALAAVIKASEARMSKLKKMMEEMGVVKALDGVNRDVWEGMGKVNIITDSGILKATLSFDYVEYYAKRERLYEDIYGMYQEEVHGGGPDGVQSLGYRSREGWHKVYIGDKVIGINAQDYKSFIEVGLKPPGGVGYAYELAIKDESVRFHSPDIERLTVMRDMEKFGTFSINNFYDSHEASARFNSKEDSIVRVSQFLDAILVLDCRERIRRKELPRYFLETQNRSFADVNGRIGKQFSA